MYVHVEVDTLLLIFLSTQVYLLDNSDNAIPLQRDKTLPEEWTLVKNQIFLGVLGSLIIPRKETRRLLRVLNAAGVRFVYFSPRNMRRQKELASQMGIDVAWNCAISLRQLEHGCEQDPHRMVSKSYANWYSNSKLPHGIEAVRTHLEQVDNGTFCLFCFPLIHPSSCQCHYLLVSSRMQRSEPYKKWYVR